MSRVELLERKIENMETEPLPAKAGRFKLLLKQPKVVSAQGYRFSPPLLSYFKVI